MLEMTLIGGLAMSVGMLIIAHKLIGLRVLLHARPNGIRLDALADCVVTFGVSGLLLYSGTVTGAIAGLIGGVFFSAFLFIAKLFVKAEP